MFTHNNLNGLPKEILEFTLPRIFLGNFQEFEYHCHLQILLCKFNALGK